MLTRLFTRSFIIPNSLTTAPRYSMSLLSDYLSNKTQKKQDDEFKKQMEYLANKPTFTLLDYKTRIQDEYNKLKSKVQTKVNAEADEQLKNLSMERKIMFAMFDEELNCEVKLKHEQKKQIALVSQLPMESVAAVMEKFQQYDSMHKTLRQLRENNEPLPESVQELQQLYMMSKQARQNKRYKYFQYKQYNRGQKNRQFKKMHNHGYFDV